MIRVGMENHIYRFNNEIRIQKKGGPIGLALTGEVADCYMLNWDKMFLKKLKSIGINPHVYSRLKDDIVIACEALEKGSLYKNGNIIIDDLKKVQDECKTDTKITMEVLQTIANEIDAMLTFTIDTPCNYSNGKMPVLDVEVCINEKECNRIDYEFYEKPTKNQKVILSDSALSAASKRTILTQECLRRMRNTKIELGAEVRIKHLTNFMLKLKNSGYGCKYRMEVLNSADHAFSKMLEDDKNDVKPLFRSREWNKDVRKE